MKRFTRRQVLFLHAQLLEQFGGTAGIRDEGLLDTALASPFQTFGGQPLYPSIQAKAAQLGFGLVSDHAFVDGNKRIGAQCNAGLFEAKRDPTCLRTAGTRGCHSRRCLRTNQS